ncbi:MAG: hypothetical protein QXE28_04735 [Desulfurococcaceae archaeon]
MDKYTPGVGVLDQSVASPLGELVEKLKFEKLNTALVVLPSFFAFPSMLLLLLGFTTLLRALTERPMDLAESYALFPGLYLTAGLLFSAGFTLSSMVSSYVLLRTLRKHLYSSGVAVYYFKGEQNYLSLLQQLENTVEKTALPSPVTGLILALLTSGLFYPVLLVTAEMTIRKHRRLEEKVLFDKEYTSSYGALHAAVDLALFIATLGLHMVYMSYRTARAFNKHVEEVHSSHPAPPSSPPQKPLENTVEPQLKLLTGLCLIVLGLAAVLSYLGVMASYYVYACTGLLISLVPATTRSKGFARTVLVVFAVMYMVIAGGVLSGLLGYTIYINLYREFTEQTSYFLEVDALTRSFIIFLNNLAISAPSVIPLLGGLTLATGVFNAGLILGVLTTHQASLFSLVVLVLPHSVLEILAYSIMVSASVFYGEPRKYAGFFAMGALVLLLAALVETITIELLR